MITSVPSVQFHFATRYAAQYQLNDRAHRESHFIDVMNAGLSMNSELQLGHDRTLIVSMAWTHDLFAWSRANHHTLSCQWILTTDDPLVGRLHPTDRERVAYANLEHRASYTGDYSSEFSELMASADRGFASVPEIFRRAYQYAQDHRKLGDEEALQASVEHLQEKFGRDGYMKLPDLYQRYFKHALEERYRLIDGLTQVSITTLQQWVSEPAMEE